MEDLTSKSTLQILLLLALLLLSTTTTGATTDQELDAALSALRSHGFTLFANAVATSDLRFLLLLPSSSATFTLFSPPDHLLYSLDLASPADHYTRSLLLHVSPTLLRISSLGSAASASPGRCFIDTLAPHGRLLVEESKALVNGTVLESVSVNRVRVSVPDLFVGSGIVVHGL
ncbi:hypothetical protein Tsubulata_020872, partial [Turnera subulata]